MQEYSRRAATAESRLEEIHKRSVHHDDHLRVVDAWWNQVLEEMELLVESKVSSESSGDGKTTSHGNARTSSADFTHQAHHI